MNCVLLQRTEARYGDGDRIFDENEYKAAFNAFYDLFNGTQTMLGAPRHIRVGIELTF